jgi:hypothetical protein
VSEPTTETPVQDVLDENLPPFCEDGCGERVTPGLVFGKPRRYIRGHGPQAKGKGTPAKTPASPRSVPPTVDELKGTTAASGDEDRAPGASARPPKGHRGKGAKPPVDVPPFRAGPIATGMNKLYARTGKILRVMDPDIGNAVLASTRKESEDDVTVGEAWEELARVNPRIRATLLKMIQGGAWGQLMMAHAPIIMAILMKDAVRRRIPMFKLVSALFDQDDDGTSAGGDFTGGMNSDDMAQAMAMAQDLVGQMFGGQAPGQSSRAANGTGRGGALIVPVVPE